MSTKAEIDLLFHCFYAHFGVTKGHPVLSFRWPLTPMPEPEVGEVYSGRTFNMGSTNTTLVRDGGKNIIIDPGILQLGRYGVFSKRLEEFDLTFEDIDTVVNTHCHYDHIEANYLFRGKPLLVHEREVEYCGKLYWPEFRGAFFGIMDVQKISGEHKVTGNVKIIETEGHTPGSISVLVDTEEGLVAVIGDAAVVKEDLLELKAPSVVTKNIEASTAIRSLKKIRDLEPVLVIPGHDAPFRITR